MAKTKKAPAIERTQESGKISVPEGVSLKTAAEWLLKQHESEQQWVEQQEIVDAHPIDAWVALVRVLRDRYGFVGTSASEIAVPIGPNYTESFPWGQFKVAQLKDGGFFMPDFIMKNGAVRLVVNGVMKRFQLDEWETVMALVREHVRDHSILRGKAVRLALDAMPESPYDLLPSFIDLEGVNPSELIFKHETQAEVETSLFAPILHTDVCRAHGVPLKRGVLLSGPYGVGKTMAAMVAAKHCIDNGWTFYYLAHPGDLEQAIRSAQLVGGPCVIFAEDVDQAIGHDRDRETNAILNAIDGLDTKDSDTMVVLTTNHIESIGQAMLRPGRLDALIAVEPPDAEAVERLVRQYGGDSIPANEDLTDVGLTLQGTIPAVIEEVTKRSKLAAIMRDPDAKPLRVLAADLLVAARTMGVQLELLQAEPTKDLSAMEKAAATLADAIRPSNGASATKAARPSRLRA